MLSVISPGEALVIPGLVEQEVAMKVGRGIRDALESGYRLEDRQSLISDYSSSLIMPLDEDAVDALDSVNTQIESMFASAQPRSTYLAATYMDSPTRFFDFHVDPDFEVRSVVNVSDFETTVVLSRQRAHLAFPKQFYCDPPATDQQVTITLEPGDCYILDNRLAKTERRPHKTPSKSVGRTALRYNFLYPRWATEPICLEGINAEETTRYEKVV